MVANHFTLLRLLTPNKEQEWLVSTSTPTMVQTPEPVSLEVARDLNMLPSGILGFFWLALTAQEYAERVKCPPLRQD